VPASFTGAKRLANEALLVAQLPAQKLNFKASVWKSAKPQLRRESNGKCAYCEAPTEVVAHGDVEHFRPKSVYWWLAYCYDNYLYACQLCNETHKGDKFTVEAAALQAPKITGAAPAAGLAPNPLNAAAVKKFLQRCEAERPLLIDPYIVDPEELLAWEEDENLREVRVAPRKKAGLARRRAERTIADLGLNREELCLWRYSEYRTLAVLRQVVEGTTGALQQTAKDEIRRRFDASAPYAAMSRYFVVRWALGL
jgi:hypothetical protein